MSRLIARFDVSYPNFHLHVEFDVPACGMTVDRQYIARSASGTAHALHRSEASLVSRTT